MENLFNDEPTKKVACGKCGWVGYECELEEYTEDDDRYVKLDCPNCGQEFNFIYQDDEEIINDETDSFPHKQKKTKMKTKRGGARKGAGRKKSKNKKQRVELWIERLKIKELGGKKKTKQHLYRLLAVAPLTSKRSLYLD